jgi:hypothetical protein
MLCGNVCWLGCDHYDPTRNNDCPLDKIQKLEAQIESMKCCGNCQQYRNSGYQLCNKKIKISGEGEVPARFELPKLTTGSRVCDKWEARG